MLMSPKPFGSAARNGLAPTSEKCGDIKKMAAASYRKAGRHLANDMAQNWVSFTLEIDVSQRLKVHFFFKLTEGFVFIIKHPLYQKF